MRELSTPEIELNVDDKQVCSRTQEPLQDRAWQPTNSPLLAFRKCIASRFLRTLEGMIKKTVTPFPQKSRDMSSTTFSTSRNSSSHWWRPTVVGYLDRRGAGRKTRGSGAVYVTKAINELNRLLNDGGTVLVQPDNQASFTCKGRMGLYAADFKSSGSPNTDRSFPSSARSVPLVREELLARVVPRS